MRAVGRAVLFALGGYAAGVAIGFAGVTLLSSIQHDRSLEALMSGFFFFGPVFAVLAAAGSLFRATRGAPR